MDNLIFNCEGSENSKIIDRYLEMSKDEMLEHFPRKAGMFFTGCPNCDGGIQEKQLSIWSPDKAGKITCNYCGMEFPNEKYPINNVVKVNTPAGNHLSYGVYEDDKGFRYFFEAKMECVKNRFYRSLFNSLWSKYKETNNDEYAKKAILILHEFTKYWGDYCWNFDYPFAQNYFYDGYVKPSECRSDYRTKQLEWWGYLDLDRGFVSVFGEITKDKAIIERMEKEDKIPYYNDIKDCLCTVTDHLVAQQYEVQGNHKPDNVFNVLGTTVTMLGIILNRLDYIHFALPVIRKYMIEQGCYPDGTWHETTSTYFHMVIDLIKEGFSAYDGYKDAEDYIPSGPYAEYDSILDGDSIEKSILKMQLMDKADKFYKMPSGNTYVLNDSFGRMEYPYDEFIGKKLNSQVMSCTGIARLSEKDMAMFFDFSRKHDAHNHHGGLGIVLEAYGREMLSDIGYSVTNLRGYADSTLAHNTVVVDSKSQNVGKAFGKDNNYCDVDYIAFFKNGLDIIKCSYPQLYKDDVSTYDRNIFKIPLPNNKAYFLDAFTIKGGERHDYLLHGDCIAMQKVYIDGINIEDNKKYMNDINNEVEIDGYGSEYSSVTGVAYKALTEKYIIEKDDKKSLRISFKYTGHASQDRSKSFNKDVLDEGDTKLGLSMVFPKGTEGSFFAGQGLSLRPADRDNEKTRDFTRAFVMWQKEPKKNDYSRFVTAIEPYNNRKIIDSVEKILDEEDSFIYLVNWGNTKDIVFYNVSNYRYMDISFSGMFGVVRIEKEKSSYVLISDTHKNASINTKTDNVQMPFAFSGELLECEDNIFSGKLVIKGECSFNQENISFIIVDRADRKVIVKVKKIYIENGKTMIECKERPGFNYNNKERSSLDTGYPNIKNVGIHTVTIFPAISNF